MSFAINKKKQIIINIASSLIAFSVNLIINFFLSPYIIKNLGEEVNGFVQLANNFITYASLITIALNSMAGRFISISYHKKEINSANKYYSSLIVGNLIILILLVLPSIYCIYRLENILNISFEHIVSVKILFAFVFMSFYISQITGIFSIATYVTNKLYLSNIVNIFRSLLNVILLIVLFAVLTPKIYFVSLVGFILSLFTLFSSYLIKVKILDDINFSIKNFDAKCIIQMISSGIWNTINQCGNILMTGLDLLIANIFIDPIQMGLLSVSKIVPNSIIQLANIINSNFSPSLVIVYSTGEKEQVLKELRSSMKISSVLISIPIMVFCVFGIEFYKLWMPMLDSNTLIILSILAFIAFIPFSGPQVLYNVYTTTNRLALNSVTVVMSGMVNFVLVVLLIKSTDLGIFAIAGVSSLISIIRNMVITVPYTARILKLKCYEFYKDVFISIACCIICLTVSVIVKYLIYPNGWISLILAIFVASLISFIFNTVFVLNKDEKNKLKNMLLKGLKKNG